MKVDVIIFSNSLHQYIIGVFWQRPILLLALGR